MKQSKGDYEIAEFVFYGFLICIAYYGLWLVHSWLGGG